MSNETTDQDLENTAENGENPESGDAAPDNAAPDNATADNATVDDATHELEEPSLVATQEEMEELVNELRAEITRLKVEQAKVRTQSWLQRHPAIGALLSVGVGVAAGYGIAKWTEPARKPKLSDRARAGLRHLADVARETASGVSLDLEDRAARAGEEAREVGRRLLADAERAGASAGERARLWSEEAARRARDFGREIGEEASERARKFGEEASEQARKAQEEGTKRARDLGSKIADDVSRAEEKIGRRAKETADKVRASVGDHETTLRQSAIGLLAVVAGSMLAKKVRDLLS